MSIEKVKIDLLELFLNDCCNDLIVSFRSLDWKCNTCEGCMKTALLETSGMCAFFLLLDIVCLLFKPL